jgi:uncharacterized repeat protein (TIGR01451 family)
MPIPTAAQLTITPTPTPAPPRPTETPTPEPQPRSLSQRAYGTRAKDDCATDDARYIQLGRIELEGNWSDERDFTLSNQSISVTFTHVDFEPNTTPKRVSFEVQSVVNTRGIAAAFVKAGPDGNMYEFDPPKGPGDGPSEWMVAPDGKDIGHVSFCVLREIVTPTPISSATPTPTTTSPVATSTPTHAPTFTLTPTLTPTPPELVETFTPTTTLTATITPTLTPEPEEVTITFTKILECDPIAAGPISGTVTVTVTGVAVKIIRFEDWIEYSLPDNPDVWIPATTTTAEAVPPITFPVTARPGTYVRNYRGSYSGVPPDATEIRNVLVLVTDLPGDPLWNELIEVEAGAYGTASDPVQPCYVGPTSTPTSTPIPTPGMTNTPTPTPVPGATNTPSPPPGATDTPTPSPGATDTPTRTSTPSPTSTTTQPPGPIAPSTPPVPEVSTAKSVIPSSAENGAPVTFSVTVTNPGATSLVEVVVVDVLPPGLSFVSASDDGTYDTARRAVSWRLGELPADAMRALSVNATLSQPGEWTNSVCAGGLDGAGTRATDCADTTLNASSPSPTPTSTSTPAPGATASPTRTATATPTLTPDETVVLGLLIEQLVQPPPGQVPIQVPIGNLAPAP